MAIKALDRASGEITIVGSKFLYFSFLVENEDMAQEYIAQLKKQFFDATHVCYAYIISDNLSKFSDDGEPSSSAGQPILSVLKSGGYNNSLIAVVRYFGGTKLGVGGLIRAYTDCAKAAEESAEKIKFVMCEKYFFKISFSDYKKIEKNQLITDLEKKDIVYSDCVEVTAYSSKIDFASKINSITLGKVCPISFGEEKVRI